MRSRVYPQLNQETLVNVLLNGYVSKVSFYQNISQGHISIPFPPSILSFQHRCNANDQESPQGCPRSLLCPHLSAVDACLCHMCPYSRGETTPGGLKCHLEEQLLVQMALREENHPTLAATLGPCLLRPTVTHTFSNAPSVCAKATQSLVYRFQH